LFLTGCKDIFKDEELTLGLVPNYSDQIKINGYYYQSDSITTNVVVWVFYRNGIVCFLGTGRSLGYFENAFQNKEALSNIYANKSAWGLYQLNNDTIITNGLFLYPGELRRISTISKGTILTDTTILFKLSIKSNNTIYLRNDTLHFKQFSPKPDSTNVFIK
jgi:hypothetical protein